jgi:hypothetical protein
MYKTVKILLTAYDKAKTHCNNNGIKLQHFISEAVQEKLNKTPKG